MCWNLKQREELRRRKRKNAPTPAQHRTTGTYSHRTRQRLVLEWGSQLAPCRPLPPAPTTEFQNGGRSPVLGNAVVLLRKMAGRLAEPYSREPCAGILKQREELRRSKRKNAPTPAQHNTTGTSGRAEELTSSTRRSAPTPAQHSTTFQGDCTDGTRTAPDSGLF
jgi:hypothetical protein